MWMYEYKVVFAPKAKKPLLKFWQGNQEARNLSDIFNELALENWEYQCSEAGTGKDRSMLVFRRTIPKLEETSQRDVAQVIAPATFERPIVPRRPRPPAYDSAEQVEFKAKRSEGVAEVTPLRLESALAAAR